MNSTDARLLKVPRRDEVGVGLAATIVMAAVAASATKYGFLVWLPLAPVWISAVRRVPFLGPLTAGLALCLLGGPLLAVLNPGGGTFDTTVAVGLALILGRTVVLLPALVWAGSLVGPRKIAVAYALAELLLAFGTHGPPDDATMWKWYFAWPAILLGLAALDVRKGRASFVLSILLVLVVALLSEYRALFGFVAAAVLIVTLVPVAERISQAKRQVRPLLIGMLFVVIAAVVTVLYGVAERLMLSGLFGEDVATKTREQVEGYGSLLAGGRVETLLTWRLMTANPLGFGPGYVPTSREMTEGTYSTLGVLNDDYVTDYLFAGQIKLHSFWGDLWVNFGFVGLATWAVMVAAVLLVLWNLMRTGRIRFFSALVAVWTLWHLFFSPIYSNLGDVAVMLAILLVYRAQQLPPSRKSTEHGGDRRAQ